MRRGTGALWIGIALLAFAALRVLAIQRVAFNWDEFALLHDVARSLRDGRLYSSGHAGLPQAALMAWVEDCRDEIAVGRGARAIWLVLSTGYVAGIYTLLYQLLPADRRRVHDAALGTALLGLLPAFLEWSLQVRADQVALVGGVWGCVALLASRRRPALALAAGFAFGVGWLGTQKLAYLAALGGVLGAGDLWLRSEWRPGREALRAAGATLAAGAVVLAWRAFVLAAFDVSDDHAALSGASAESVRNYFDVFDFYRQTIGYSQYLAAWPTLLPHLALWAAMLAVSLGGGAARDRRLLLGWAVFGLGIAVGAFHAAAFAYFLMTLGLFFAVALALALPSLRAAAEARFPDALRLAVPVLWGALILGGGLQSAAALRDTQAVQRESLDFVHRNFAPDHAGFHPETALFCGVEQPLGLWFSQRIYREFGSAESEAELERRVESWIRRFRNEPVHYLVQSFRLNQFPTGLRRFWSEHYQPYRASVFVAGPRLAGNAGEVRDFELLIDGPYRWLPIGGDHPIRIDERELAPGDVIQLEARSYRAAFDRDGARGVLLLSLADPPGPAPLPFYKSY